MTTVMLWLASFTLHGVLIYFVLILYTRLKATHDMEAKQRQLLEETENTLTAFLIELKDENRELKKQLEVPEATKSKHFETKNQSTNEKSENKEELPSYIESLLKETERNEAAVMQPEQEIQLSFDEQAVALFQKGHSIEEIARKLKSGKTEIELLLKFRGMR
ncbi:MULTISPECIES: DUF6115 domain-containing protein [Bacillus]|uniref:Swarming motility protein SwrB n=3 Tax=Bacillus TaxID=1386 RepID=A0A0M4FII1_9BACI|nr:MULTISPECIES: hypothetical protein [Bacillus]ALC81079.1 Swarming motility protein SwrB [Bacillus gobiensis]MBP1080040.1 ATP-dependent 26S proteasome regulatory subunit [Bacillus capparidis]MED1095429.1 Swarming motility protein SwrB [Bacillus capparidis]